MIHFRCPECHASVRGPEGLAGRTVQCPKCSRRIAILISGGVPLATSLRQGGRASAPVVVVIASVGLMIGVMAGAAGVLLWTGADWRSTASAPHEQLERAASLELELAKLYLAGKNVEKAKQHLRQLLNDYPGTTETQEAWQLLRQLEGKPIEGLQ